MDPDADTSRGEYARAKTVVFRMLKVRLRSEKEVVDKLDGKDFPADVIQKTVRYFRDTGLLDDRLFARGWIASRLKKPLGFSRIRRELKMKGLSDDIVQEECARVADDYDEQESIHALAERRMRQYRTLDRVKAQQRLYAYLARRGFSSGLIYKVIREIEP